MMMGIGTLCLALAGGPARASGQEAIHQALDIIEQRYGDRVDADALWQAATAGVAAGLDIQLGLTGSAILDASQYADSQRWAEGHRQGIGVEFSIAAGQGLLITDVFEGGPADAVGVRPRDLVVGMDGHPFIGQPAPVIHAVVAQASGPQVILEVHREGDRIRRLEVDRGPYDVSAVRSQPVSSGVLLVRIPFFGSGTARSLAEALATLPDDGSAVVLDLRENVGGQLHEAVAAADLFLPEGAVILQLEGPGGQRTLKTASGRRSFNGSVVALMNQGTRGAAEAFLASLHGHGVGKLVGTRTAGEAAVPSYHPIGTNLMLRIPEYTMLDPVGVSWRGRGIDPDIVVEPVRSKLPSAPGSMPPDLQRDAAVQLIAPAGLD